MKLRYSQQSGSVTNSTGTWEILSAPELGFVYDGIFYNSSNNSALKYLGEGRVTLTPDEIFLVTAYLQKAMIPGVTQLTLEESLLKKRAEMPPLTAWQVRKVLIEFGLREQVEAAILQANLSIQDSWNYAKSFQRDDSTLNAMAVALSIDAVSLDQMFTLGVTL